MTTSAYIHIPFCKSKCKYCAFVSYTNHELQNEYIKALLRDITTNYKQEPLKTLYFGGGTPSLLKISEIEKIIQKFIFSKKPEITFELNPDDASFEYLKSLNELGINRLSIGAQTFDNQILEKIGRRHSAEQTIKAVEIAKDAGFKNISLDLIYGLPGKYNFADDLKKIIELDVQHISTYGLKIEENSYFWKKTPINLPDDDEQANLYMQTIEYLTNKGFSHYEISNFAKPNYESKHNLNYWKNKEYYGFGAAAHGYKDSIRYSNHTTLKKYIYEPTSKESSHFISITEKLEEEIFLGFRINSGLDINKINNTYKINFNEKYKSILTKYLPEYIEETESGYRLTTKGLLLSTIILADFLN